MARFTELEKQIRKTLLDNMINEGRCLETDHVAKQYSLSAHELSKAFKNLEAGICIALTDDRHAEQDVFQEEKLTQSTPRKGEIFYIRPFAAFANHYPIWVDGKQKWYAECAVEACGMSNIFPGSEVVIKTICRQTKTPIELSARNGYLKEIYPGTALVHIGFPLRKLPDDIIGWCDYNSFFCSQEAAMEWRSKHPDVRGRIMNPLDVAKLCRKVIYKGRLDFEYMMKIPILEILLHPDRFGIVKHLSPLRIPLPDPFWMPTPTMLPRARKRGYKNYISFTG